MAGGSRMSAGWHFTRCSPSRSARHCVQFHIKALYWSTVINGVLATPVMTMLMLLVCIVGMAISMLMPTTS